MRTLFKQYLSNKNIEFTTDSQNIISFIYKQHHYLMIHDEEDPNYFCICLPDVEASDTITDDIRTKINQISREYKVAKIIEIGNGCRDFLSMTPQNIGLAYSKC